MSRAAVDLPSLDLLRTYFIYDGENGILLHNLRRRGRPAGYKTGRGYIQVCVQGKLYFAHRVIWKMHTGEEPPPELDHRDGNPSHNRFANLRAATHVQNIRNKATKAGKDTPLGVHRYRGKFTAKIGIGGKTIHLGTFETSDQASAVYQARAASMFGEFAKHRSIGQ